VLIPLLPICHRCPFAQLNQPGFKGGACACTADPQGRDITVMAKAGECPHDLFKDPANVAYPPAPNLPPRKAALNAAPPTPKIHNPGPGTELKRLLAKIGIHSSPTCYCNKMAAEMDANGGAWSLENADIIVDVMRSEAAKRKLPFVEVGARLLIRRAVKNAERRK
jgi:hypothetical protein